MLCLSTECDHTQTHINSLRKIHSRQGSTRHWRISFLLSISTGHSVAAECYTTLPGILRVYACMSACVLYESLFLKLVFEEIFCWINHLPWWCSYFEISEGGLCSINVIGTGNAIFICAHKSSRCSLQVLLLESSRWCWQLILEDKCIWMT